MIPIINWSEVEELSELKVLAFLPLVFFQHCPSSQQGSYLICTWHIKHKDTETHIVHVQKIQIVGLCYSFSANRSADSILMTVKIFHIHFTVCMNSLHWLSPCITEFTPIRDTGALLSLVIHHPQKSPLIPSEAQVSEACHTKT